MLQDIPTVLYVLQLLGARWITLAGSEYNAIFLGANSLGLLELSGSLRSLHPKEIEVAAACRNMRELFHLIHVSGTKKQCVNETICEVYVSLKTDLSETFRKILIQSLANPPFQFCSYSMNCPKNYKQKQGSRRNSMS